MAGRGVEPFVELSRSVSRDVAADGGQLVHGWGGGGSGMWRVNT